MVLHTVAYSPQDNDSAGIVITNASAKAEPLPQKIADTPVPITRISFAGAEGDAPSPTNEILIATAQAYSQQHSAETDKILKAKASVDQKLKTYLLNRFRAVQAVRQSGSHAAELARTVIALQPEFKEAEDPSVKDNVLSILREGIQTKVFHIEDLERDLQVFLCSIGVFFPIPTTEKYYEPDEEKLCLVIDWFIEKWSKV